MTLATDMTTPSPATGTAGNSLLELRNVSQNFPSGPFWNREYNHAVNDVSFTLDDKPALITAVAGESGSGKTTLGRIMLGFQRPTSGQVLFAGRNVGDMSGREHKQYRRQVQAIFQDPFSVYNPFYKVDHIFTVAIARFGLASSRDEARHLIEEAIIGVGLRPSETLGRYPHQLSGGQRQRVMVARSLLLKPQVIIADEPVSMVDASLRATILETLRTLNHELGIAILYITHDLTTAYQVADNIMIMYRGHVVEAGDVEHVINDPKHPYTRLLVQSIPMPDPSRRWADMRGVNDPPFAGIDVTQGMCPFANRCPDALSACVQDVPSTYELDEHRISKCFLYKDAGPISNLDIASYFNVRDSSSSSNGANENM